MSIARVTGSNLGLSGSEVASSEAPAQADVAWFKAAMHKGADQPATVSADSASQPLAMASMSSQHSSEKASRALQKAAKSVDPQQVLQANRSLSSFYLESMLSTKLVSKATQSVEKLTSLQ